MFGFFKKHTVHLCPEVKGSITLNGEPVANQKVERHLFYADDIEIKESSLTDGNGQFHFPEKNIKSRHPGALFDVPGIKQVIGITFENQDFLLWFSEPFGTTPNKELTRILRNLECDLSNPKRVYEFKCPEAQGTSYNHWVKGILTLQDTELLK